MLSLALCHCEGGKSGVNAGRTPCRGDEQPQRRGTKTSRPLLLGQRRIFIPCSVRGSCWEERSRFCLDSDGGSGAGLLGNTEKVHSTELGAGWCFLSCAAPVQTFCRIVWSLSPRKVLSLLRLSLLHSSSCTPGFLVFEH